MKKIVCEDLIATLESIMRRNTKHYREDFEGDRSMLTAAAAGSPSVFLWMSRPCGTCCFPERDVFIRGTYPHIAWLHYRDQEPQNIRAYAVEVTGERDGKVQGTLYKLDYLSHCEEVARCSVPAGTIRLEYERGEIYVPAKTRWDKTPDENLGDFLNATLIPNDPDALTWMLREQRNQRSKMKESVCRARCVA